MHYFYNIILIIFFQDQSFNTILYISCLLIVILLSNSTRSWEAFTEVFVQNKLYETNKLWFLYFLISVNSNTKLFS